jgi:hypothetical protein
MAVLWRLFLEPMKDPSTYTNNVRDQVACMNVWQFACRQLLVASTFTLSLAIADRRIKDRYKPITAFISPLNYAHIATSILIYGFFLRPSLKNKLDTTRKMAALLILATGMGTIIAGITSVAYKILKARGAFRNLADSSVLLLFTSFATSYFIGKFIANQLRKVKQ